MSAPLALPRLGLGGAAIGGLYTAVSDADAEAAVLAALGAGMSYIDTAPRYGHGRSEARIGAALRSWRGPAPMLSTKVGRVLEPAAPGEEGEFGFADPLPFRPVYDYSRDGVRRSLEASLARLGVARVDIALLHDIGAETHGAAHAAVLGEALEGGLAGLAEARAEGLVGAVGIGVNEIAVCFETLERAEIDCILLAGRYTLMDQSAQVSGLLDLCAARGVAVIAGGVFNSGLLAAPPGQASTYDYAPASAAVLARAQAIWGLCEQFGVAPQAAALRFALAHPAIACVIAGARSAAEVAHLLRWRAAPLPGELWTALKRAGHIEASAPTGAAED